MASPLYTAPGELLTAIIAYLPAFAGSNPAGLTPGFHPRMVPSSVAKRKMAGALPRVPAAVKTDRMNAPRGGGGGVENPPPPGAPAPPPTPTPPRPTLPDTGLPPPAFRGFT